MDDDAADDQHLSSAEAHAAAARANTSDLVGAIEDDAAAGQGAEQEDGSSPEPASSAATDDGDGSSPTAGDEPANSDDGDEWTEDERKLRAQYKSDRELVRALRETKAHSNEQHRKLKELEAKLAGNGDDRSDAPEDGERAHPAQPRQGSPSADTEDALPNTPEVQSARRFMATAADQYDAQLETIKTKEKDLVELDRNLLKLAGKIEDVEQALKDPELDDFGKDRLKGRLAELKQSERDSKSDITRTRLERQEAQFEAGRLHRDYHDRKTALTSLARQHRAAAEAQTKENERLQRETATEKANVSAALDRVIAKHKVPEKARERLKTYLLRDAEAHPGRIPTNELDAYFDKRAKWHLETVEAFRAPADASYAANKRRDAEQPAPRGAGAVARPRQDAPVSSKDAHRAAMKGSRIPIA